MRCSICGSEYEAIVSTVTDKKSSTNYCPNCLMFAVYEGTLNVENEPLFVDEITGVQGAVLFDTHHARYVLDKDSFIRLVSHSLYPAEYKALVARHGTKEFHLHDCFYDDNGVALQPALN